jgi:MFS family permease
LVPALQPTSGSLLVAANFFAYAFGALIPARFLMKRRRLCFTLGMIAHAQWIAVLQVPFQDGNPGLIVLTALSSIINGFGAGLLWSTEGGWIGEFCSLDDPKNAAYFTGVFLALYGASGIIGNIAAALALYFAPNSLRDFIWYLFATAMLGVVIMVCSPQPFLYIPKFDALEVGANEVDDMQSCVSDAETKPESFSESLESLFDLNASESESTSASTGTFTLVALTAGLSKRFYNGAANGAVDSGARVSRLHVIGVLFRETIFARSICAIAAHAGVQVFAWVSIPSMFSSSNNIFWVPALFALYAIATTIGAPLSTWCTKRLSIPAVFSAACLVVALPLVRHTDG